MDFKNPYKRENFYRFFQNDFLTNNFQIKDENIEIYSFKPEYIKEVTLIGEDSSLDGLKVYEVKHKPEYDIRYRVGLTKEVFKVMSNYANNKALCIFYSDEAENYRLSLVTMDIELDDKRIVKKISNPKRFSFYLGPDAKTHTPEQFLSKKVASFEDLKKRFSIEVVNKEFYNNIATFFNKLAGGKRYSNGKEVDYKEGVLKLPENVTHEKRVEFCVRLIGRIVFCWFLKKKLSTDGIPLIDETVLSKDVVGKYNNYYHDVLEKLFFKVLNTPVYARDDEIKNSIFKDIPFLNGGLFSPHKDDYYQNKDLFIPNEWFKELFELLETYNFTIDENTPSDIELSVDPEMLGRIFENLLAEINPETGESARKSSGSYYTPRQIVDYMVTESLKQYLLTKTEISEDKVNNLLADYSSNDELDLTLNEAKQLKEELIKIKILDPTCGSAAFPMGILHKILNARIKIDRLIVNFARKESKENRKENIYIKKGEKIIYKPDDLLYIECTYLGEYNFQYKIFENGTLKESGVNKVTDVALIVKAYINFYNAKQNKKTVANLFSQGKIEGGVSFNTLRTKENVKRIVDKDNEEIILWEWKDYNVKNKTRTYRNEGAEEEIDIDENYFADEYSYSKYIYELKKEIILNSIYGVDIQPIAVEISKLRAFLSLVVDEKVDDEKENRGIEPLPNLEFKFICANSLIGLDKYDKSLYVKDNFFEERDPFIRLIGLRNKYFISYDKEKEKIKNEFLTILKGLNNPKSQKYLYSSDKDLKLITWDPFSNEPADWFDPEWMFGVKDGFDIVIANPPYIKEYTRKEAFDGLRESPYYQGKMDIWYFFVCKGIDLLKKNGILTFIAQNNWVTNTGASKIRKKVIEDTKIIQLIDFGPYLVFENANTQTMIMMFQKDKLTDNYKIDYRKILSDNGDSKVLSKILNKELAPVLEYLEPTFNKSEFKDKNLTFANKSIEMILSKINGINGKGAFKFKKEEITQGIVCPQDFLNKESAKKLENKYLIGTGIFVISEAEKMKLILYEKEKEIVKPYYTTEELKRYYGIRKNNCWILYTKSDMNKKINNYPNIKKHLDQFAEIITSDFGPYGLHRAREEKFFKGEKIISLRKCEKPTFTYTNFDCYVSQTFFVIKTNRLNMKYLTGLLNSKVIAFWLWHKGKKQGTNYQIDAEPLLNLSLPLITHTNEPIVKQIEVLVDKILDVKKYNKNADISEWERGIDRLVYKLYDLTDEEIRIIESDK